MSNDSRYNRAKVKRAMAQIYDENEKNQIIAEKKKLLVDDQVKYKRTCLSRMMRMHELLEMKSQLESGEIKMLWYGMPYPKEILMDAYNLGVEGYADMLHEEERLKEKLLKEHKLTEEQIQGIFENNYIKEPVIDDDKKQNTSGTDYVG